MVNHRKHESHSSLYLCDIVSSRTLHNKKTRCKGLFSWTSFSRISSRGFLNTDYPTTTPYFHARGGDDSFPHYISHTLYACHEDVMDTEKYISYPRRMFDTSMDIWWRSLCSRSHPNSSHARLYIRLRYNSSYSSLCSSLTFFKYFSYLRQHLSQMQCQ